MRINIIIAALGLTKKEGRALAAILALIALAMLYQKGKGE
jgi:hypothetical protein